uniref:Uncharacterized protein n=1 Tax=Anguilla anguilla TaxID=7936 RepID=A0A0E9STC0_ANGAN
MVAAWREREKDTHPHQHKMNKKMNTFTLPPHRF